MDTYRVLPRDDGQDFQGSWMVHKNGEMVDSHTTKQAAENEARRQANVGDTIRLHYQNGQFQESYTYQGGQERDETESSGMGIPGLEQSDYGQGTFETGVGDFFKR